VAVTLTAHNYESETNQVMQDLVRESFRSLLPITTLVMWVVTVAVLVLAEQHLPEGVGVLVLTLAVTWLSYNLQEQYLKLAVGVYLAGLTAVVTIFALTLPGMPVLYAYMLVVLVTATLTDATGLWAVAFLEDALVLVIGLGVQNVSLGDLWLPIIFLLLAAFTAWLSSRRLFTALGWTLRMTQEAQRNANDARERRAEVRSILKSLEEAYVRLERANQALIFAREAADKAYRFKAEFVANVSHELRTPLNLIVGFSEMVATAPESYKGIPLPHEYRGDVMAIYRAARHLGDLINDVLDLSQIEAGRLPISPEPADLTAVIGEAVEIVRGLAEAKGLSVEVQVPPELPILQLDRTRIRQVLLNLLTNATRFTDKGYIRVRAALDGQEVKVQVEDSGRGIAAERISRAFEAFSQLDEDRAREGTGLGLAVSRKFVELHGGAMWIKSELGQGTVVGFSLPTPCDSAAPPAVLIHDAPVPAALGHLRVLVLHDEPHALALLHRYIGGYQFLLAEDEERALAVIDEGLPVAVIVDSSWGGDWSHIVARRSEVAALPVLTCSLPSLRRLGLALGATDFLAKPVSREDLLGALSHLGSEPHTVLVVDDDPNFARLLVRMLKASEPRLRVLEAAGAVEGLDLMRSQRPDLVLLDLLMPGLSGYEVLAQAQRDEALAGTPIILISGQTLDQETAPIVGDLSLKRPTGLTLNEILQSLQALLAAVTQPASVARASASAFPAGPSA